MIQKSYVCFGTIVLLIVYFYISSIGFSPPWKLHNFHAEPERPTYVDFGIKIEGKVEKFVYKLYQPIKGGNLASIVEEGCAKPNIQPDGSKIVLITGFINLTEPIYRKTLGDLKHISDEPDTLIIKARHMEVINALQTNLLHAAIESIHVIVFSRDTAVYLKSMNLKNIERLVIRPTGSDVGLKEQLQYASECLAGRLVAITNQDNTIGQGWENPDYKRILNEKNIMYGLTRHSTATEDPNHGSNCTWMQVKYNNCDDGGIYWRSHDTFIFRARKWPSILMEDLTNVTPDKHGMENVVLWFFNTKLNYTILNPCRILFVHHHHCVAIRGLNRPSINFSGRSHTAEFTDRLE